MGLDLGLEPGLGIEHLHDPNMLNTAVWNLDKIKRIIMATMMIDHQERGLKVIHNS